MTKYYTGIGSRKHQSKSFDLCFKHGYLPFPCQKCSTEQREISEGICPECHGEGEQGGQFCGGYWECESCDGTGKYKFN